MGIIGNWRENGSRLKLRGSINYENGFVSLGSRRIPFDQFKNEIFQIDQFKNEIFQTQRGYSFTSLSATLLKSLCTQESE